MGLPVYSHSSNPEIDSRLARKSRHYCAQEVDAGRADWLPGQKGIQLKNPETIARRSAKPKDGLNTDAHGVIKAGESKLIASSRGWWAEMSADEREERIAKIALRCEQKIEQADAERDPKRRSGLPHGVFVMTAEAKLIAYPFGDQKATRIAVGLCHA